MKYSVEKNDQKKILEIKVSETGKADDIKNMILDVRPKAFKLNYNLLYDFRKFISKVEVSDIYNLYRGELMENLRKIDPDILKLDVAIIGDTKDAELWDFTETTFFNSGISVKIFYKKNEALKWLERQKEYSKTN